MLNRPILRLPNKPKLSVQQEIGPTADAVPPLAMIATPMQKAYASGQPAPQKSHYPYGVRCPQYGGFARRRFTL